MSDGIPYAISSFARRESRHLRQLGNARLSYVLTVMAYFKNEEHYVNFFRKVFREELNLNLPVSFERQLILFYRWSNQYAYGKAHGDFSYRFKQSPFSIRPDQWEQVLSHYRATYNEVNVGDYSESFYDSIVYSLRDKAGVYFLYEGNTCVYIGRSVNLASRISQSIKERNRDGLIDYAAYIATDCKSDACILEPYFISKIQPTYNLDMAYGRTLLEIENVPEISPKIKIFKENVDRKNEAFDVYAEIVEEPF